MGRGEIAHYEQFLLFYSVFKRHVLQTRNNTVLFAKGLNVPGMIKNVGGSVENFWEQEKDAGYKHVLLLQQSFHKGIFSLGGGALSLGIAR